MDSNHRTRKRADLQSAAVGHLATCPKLKFQILKFQIENSWNFQIFNSSANSCNLGFGPESFRDVFLEFPLEPLVGIEPTTY